MAAPQPSRDAFPIVGIGASAGGLEAFSELLAHMPSDSAMAFVLVQHLDPKSPSILSEILSRTTLMPVAEVQHGARAEPGHVYVMPPNTSMTIVDGVLNLAPRSEAPGPHMPIDHFLRSLAEDMKSRAIGVILSGSASDGAQGLKAIKADGGITFAEAPTSAKFDGMPRSAMASGAVDFVLPPKAIAQELTRIGHHPYLTEPGALLASEPPSGGHEALAQILWILREKSGVDFTLYRQTTIRRRIARRMLVHGVATLEAYLRYLEEHPSQVQALHNDLLVNVTRFFRDADAFRILQQSVFPSIIKHRPADAPIRVWSPGCASGEEVYSLAIELLECLGDEIGAVPIQLFGTDVSEGAIAKARAGVYPENIELDVPGARLRRFFVKMDGQYQVRKTVRELCVFAKHNLATDPPFSKMDLIVCRNVLIYLESELQRRVLSIFHYALKTPGFLLLGVSETVGPLADLFSVVDKKYKVYAKRPTSRRLELGLSSLDRRIARAGTAEAGRTGEAHGGRSDLMQAVDRILLGKYAPAGVLVNEAADILQFRGHTSPYLEPAPGQASLNLLKMAREGLLMELRVAIDKARKQNAPVRRERLSIKQNGRSAQVNLQVIPVSGPARERNYLVLFECVPPLVGPKGPAGKARGTIADPRRQIESLRQELTATKEFLQSIIEERQAANQELQAANEELLSSNEELQSTNEELETAKEELQSVNEELTTVNEELQHRNVEQSHLNSDLNNLFTSVNIPIVMLDGDGRIRRFTPVAAKVLNLIPADLGRPIGDIRLKLDLPDLEQLCRHVSDTATIVEREVRDRDGGWHSLRLRPYATTDNKIDGTVITMEDISAVKLSVEQVTTAREHAETIVDNVPVPLVLLDAELRVVWASRLFHETFQLSPVETTNHFVYELGNGRWNLPALQRALAEVLEKNVGFHEFEIEDDYTRIGAKTMLLNARRMQWGEKAGLMILLAIADITERKKAERELR